MMENHICYAEVRVNDIDRYVVGCAVVYVVKAAAGVDLIARSSHTSFDFKPQRFVERSS